MDKNQIEKLLTLARDLAGRRTDAGLLKAAEVLLQAADEGCKEPEILVMAAKYLLQGPHLSEYVTKARSAFLVDKAMSQDPADPAILENAIFCYELVLNEFPEKLEDIIRISLKILDLNPDNVEAMITLSSHRCHPSVSLSLSEAIQMMEWAKEVEPANILADYKLARLYTEAGQYGKARAIYHKINTDVNLDQQPIAHGKNKRYRRYGVN